MPLHIHTPIGLKRHAFFFQKCALSRPPRSCTSFFVYHPMARQLLCPRRVTECSPHHPRMTGPSRQSSDMSIRCHPSTRNLTDNVQHILTKHPHLFCRHSIGIVLHLCVITLLYDLPINNLPQCSQMVSTAVLIIQVVSMLPDIERQQRFQALLNRVSRI